MKTTKRLLWLCVCLSLLLACSTCSAATITEDQLALQEQNLQQLRQNLETLRANSTASESDYLKLISEINSLRQSLQQAQLHSKELTESLTASMLETEQMRISLTKASGSLTTVQQDLDKCAKQLRNERAARKAERLAWAAGVVWLLAYK